MKNSVGVSVGRDLLLGLTSKVCVGEETAVNVGGTLNVRRLKSFLPGHFNSLEKTSSCVTGAQCLLGCQVWRLQRGWYWVFGSHTLIILISPLLLTTPFYTHHFLDKSFSGILKDRPAPFPAVGPFSSYS